MIDKVKVVNGGFREDLIENSLDNPCPPEACLIYRVGAKYTFKSTGTF